MGKRQLKFSVGQRVWKWNCRSELDAFKVIEIRKRSYVFVRWYKDDTLSRIEKVMGFDAGERQFLATDEVEDRKWKHGHAHRIAERVRGLDVPTLRRVAELIGYQPDPA